MGLGILAVSILAACLAVPVASASMEESLTSNHDAHNLKMTGWNELLVAEGIFDESHNTVQVKSGDATFVIQQLKDLLNQDEVMQGIYNRYRMLFKDDTDSFSNSSIGTFKDKLLEIAAHNLEANSGKRTWWKGVNQFTDMTPTELQQMTSGGFKSYNSNNTTRTFSGIHPNRPGSPAVALPDSKNYLDENRVCPAKNQLTCNAGAIFSSVSVLESAYAIKKKRSRVTEFSEQELVNCIKAFSCDKPVSVKDVLDRVKKQALGMQADELYSNPPSKGACKSTQRVLGLQSYSISPGNSEEKLKTLLVESGPVIVELYASENLKQTYAKGVYDGADCGDNPPNHAVALIGYGSEGGKDYWLIKNSWGQNWGVQGFLKLARNGGDVCGVLKTAYTVAL